MVTPDWLNDINDSSLAPYLCLLKRIKNDNDNEITSISIIEGKPSPAEIEIVNSLAKGFSGRLPIIVGALKYGHTIHEISKYLSWNQFEQVIAALLSIDGWSTSTNFRFFNEGSPSDRSRFEIDVIAHKKPYVLVIDCKRYKHASQAPMRNAAIKQKNRINELLDMIPVIHDIPELTWIKWKEAKLVPMLVTWQEHNIEEADGVPICPSNSFSDLIANFEKYMVEKEWYYLKWFNPSDY